MTSHAETVAGRYERIAEQLRELFAKTAHPLARMATAVAVLHHKQPHFFWTGFYLLKDGDLTVGPYQGPIPCAVLEKHKGVCWAGVDQGATVVVPNVHEFPGHIACDERTNSEIVVPLKDAHGEIMGVLDVDSMDFGSFDEIDEEFLEILLNKATAG